jgi:thimet oligopeptidase
VRLLLRPWMLAAALLLGSSVLATPPSPAPIDWQLTPRQITSSCKAELKRARAGVKAAAVKPGAPEAALTQLRSIETAIASLNAALAAQKHLSFVSPDKAVREASAKCNDDISAFTISVSADPSVYGRALLAQEHAPAEADRQLAKHYVEAGRRAGAHLDAAARAEMTQLLHKLAQLKTAYMETFSEDRPTIEISKDEASSLPPSFVATLTPSKNGYVVPVNLGTVERFMKNTASGAARKRYLIALFHHGGQVNSRRVRQAIALRDRVAHLLGFDNWAAYQLDTMMAKTPDRALALLNEIDAKLLPKAREEIAVLAALKAEQGDDTPFAAWDYAYYQEQLEQTRHAVDSEAVRHHFPIDKVIPAVLELYQHLLGVRFHALEPANAWAPGVLQYAITDSTSGKPIGQFFLDLSPRPGKALRPATFTIRAGRTLPDGGYQQPISSIVGNGPASEPGKPALFSHKDVIDFFHEVGHLMHDTLSTAPYASLQGSSVRGDFIEAPSQMLENWMWQPSILKKVSSHVETSQPLPDELIAMLLARKHASDGVFWTRQAFLGVYDLTLHTSGPDVDATRLWFDLMPRLTPLPPPTGTIPAASFLPIMGGYEARYYGYAWSRVFAQDIFTVFQQGGLENPEVGMRYRREILEPGGMVEPEKLLENFLGRPVSYEAFYRELGITR